MFAALILLPAAAGLLAFFIRRDGPRRALLAAIAAAHTGMTAATIARAPADPGEGWLGADRLGLLFLGIVSALFLATAIYAVGYLAREVRAEHRDIEEGLLFANAPEAVFTGCLLLFLASMTLVTLSRHFSLLWVGVEATTLATAPLIYFHRQHRSLEAAWKYLLICSIGIALALLGNFFLAVAAPREGGMPDPLVLGALLRHASALNIPWLNAAFVCLLVGYGAKMGLAPMHTWLPDAHSEAPSVVSALLSGALLNCAFLAILRTEQVMEAAGQAAFGRQLLTGFGLLSLGFAAAFIARQPDYKRMLAYSSVEHMGILALGVGLAGAGTFGAMLHSINHSLTKAMLFLVSGNILAAYRTKSAAEVSGVARRLPVSGALWIAGFLAITGSPPFGTFLSEFTILRAALDQRRIGVAIAYLALLASIFVGMASIVLKMAQGVAKRERSAQAADGRENEPLLSIVPPAVLALGVLALGFYVPPPLEHALREIARTLGGGR